MSPMLPSRFIESSCLPCHQGVVHVPEAKKWNHGKDLVERVGCYGCHKMKGFEGLRKAGPLLTRLTWKTDPQWAYQWIENPPAFRPATWMPRFFGLSNNSSPADVARTQQEIRGMVTYLFEKTEPGGFFITGDKIAVNDPGLYLEMWDAWVLNMERFKERGHLKSYLYWRDHELTDHLRRLTEAEMVQALWDTGFVNVEVIDRLNMYAIVVGYKPA